MAPKPVLIKFAMVTDVENAKKLDTPRKISCSGPDPLGVKNMGSRKVKKGVFAKNRNLPLPKLGPKNVKISKIVKNDKNLGSKIVKNDKNRKKRQKRHFLTFLRQPSDFDGVSCKNSGQFFVWTSFPCLFYFPENWKIFKISVQNQKKHQKMHFLSIFHENFVVFRKIMWCRKNG